MAAPRKNPPKDAVETIERLAAQGFAIVGIAKNLGVSKETFKRWCEEDGAIQEAFEIGRETERQALHALIVQSAVMNKPANVNAFFILKARHGYRENDSANTNVNVGIVAPQNVMIVHDFGTDDQWAAKVAAQQRALTADSSSPAKLEAPAAPQVDTVATFGPPAYLPPVYTPQAVPVAAAFPPAPRYDAPCWQAKA
jgi:hypothetical protein